MRLPVLFLALCWAGAAGAQQAVTGNEVRKVLFKTNGIEIVANPNAGLTENQLELLTLLVESNGFKYYGAIAYSPDEGLMSETIQGAFDFHDVRVASTAALTQCEAVRKEGTRPCIVAVQVYPKRFRAVAFTLSQSATDAFAEYRRTRGDKAFAISPSTGAYGIAKGGAADAAAVELCNRTAPENDCHVAIRD